MNKRKKHGWAFWTTVTLFVLPVMYVLSFAPLCWVYSWTGGVFPPDSAIVAYEPLFTFSKWCPPFGHAFLWYQQALAKKPASAFE